MLETQQFPNPIFQLHQETCRITRDFECYPSLSRNFRKHFLCRLLREYAQKKLHNRGILLKYCGFHPENPVAPPASYPPQPPTIVLDFSSASATLRQVGQNDEQIHQNTDHRFSGDDECYRWWYLLCNFMYPNVW